ncbi:unnamed protein product [Ixodes pacificus]
MIGTDFLVDWLFQAYERRFPTCPMIPVFLGSDTVMEYKSEDGAVHVIERRCRLNVEAPYILKKIIGVDFVYFIQKNSLDRRARVLKIDAHNESFSSRVGINENCTYSVHPENPEWTCFEQSASLDVKSFFGFENAVEKLAMKQYSQNISKGKEIIEYYINELHKEGITYLPPFQEKDGSGDADRPAVEAVAVRRRSAGEKVAPPSAAAAAEAPSAQDANLKLESEYIERCLGALTPYQESCLVMLQKWIANAHQGKVRHLHTWVNYLQNIFRRRKLKLAAFPAHQPKHVLMKVYFYGLPVTCQLLSFKMCCIYNRLVSPSLRTDTHGIPHSTGKYLFQTFRPQIQKIWSIPNCPSTYAVSSKFITNNVCNHLTLSRSEYFSRKIFPSLMGGPFSGAERPDAGSLPAGAGLQPGEGEGDAVPVPGLAQEVPGGPHPQHLRPAPRRQGVLPGGLAPPRQRRVPLNGTFFSSRLWTSHVRLAFGTSGHERIHQVHR